MNDENLPSMKIAGMLAVIGLVVAGCGSNDARTETSPQKSTSPTPSTTPDDVSLTPLPTEQVILTYSDRDGVDHPTEVKVGRNYALYARCRGQGLLVELQDLRGRQPWLPPCDGTTNRMLLADGPRSIVVSAGGPAGTRWTFAVVNIRAGAK